MNRPSKKEIKDAIDKLKGTGPSGPSNPDQQGGASLSAKKPNKNRIRKQGV